MDLFSDDIVRVLLTFIPTPDLCRYRTVSKGWNDLICNRDFAVVHAQNQAKCQDASIIILHYIRSVPLETMISESGWCILDLNARRWYKFKGKRQHDVILRKYIPMGMDGGLVCQHLRNANDHNSLIVHNPISNEAKILPLVPRHETSTSIPGLNLVVDTIAQVFKVFVINHDYDKTIKLNDPSTSEEERLRIRNDPVVRVYDSATNEWQSLSNPDWDISVVGHLYGSVIFQDHLVLLFSDRIPLRNPFQPRKSLWTYSLAEKTWKIIQVDDTYRYDPKLVTVGANRLFLVSWFQIGSFSAQPSWYSLEEIKVPEMTRELVWKLSKEQVVSWFEIRARISRFLDERFMMSVIGFGKSSLMVMSNSSHKCKVFDVVTHSWNADDLLQNPLGQLPYYGNYEWVGKDMNLLLRNWQCMV